MTRRTCLALGLSLLVCGCGDPPQTADLILYGGHVLTLDAQNFDAQVVVVNKDRLVAVRGNELLSRYRHVKGTLEAGKLADMIALSDNPLTVPEEDSMKLEALATYLGGRLVFGG